MKQQITISQWKTKIFIWLPWLSDSHILSFPEFILFTIDCKNVFSSGTYQETHTGSHVKVVQVQYAHRTVLPLLVLEIDLLWNGSTQSGVQILLNTSRWYASDDIAFKEEHSGISGVRWVKHTCLLRTPVLRVLRPTVLWHLSSVTTWI